MKNKLIEYRCSCNKLLLKGFLLYSAVEVKCNRCGSINFFQNKGKNNEPVSFSFFIDSSENVAGGCSATLLFDASQKKFIGKHVQNLVSYLHGENIDFFVLPEYRSQANNFSTWDEALKGIKETKKDEPNGYHLFGKMNIKQVDSS